VRRSDWVLRKNYAFGWKRPRETFFTIWCHQRGKLEEIKVRDTASAVYLVERNKEDNSKGEYN
jgi:hypothetical protein